MIEFLPTGVFRFFPNYQINQRFLLKNIKTKVMLLADDAPKGFVFEIDSEYSKELHGEHSDYPLVPESLEITRTFYSPFQKEYFPDEPSQKRFIPNLLNKKNYIVHYRNLKQYLKMGMKITKFHRVLEFDQSPWLKPYLDFHTQCRAAATSTSSH